MLKLEISSLMDDLRTGSNKSFRDGEIKEYLMGLEPRVGRINALEPAMEDLGDDEMKAKTAQLGERLRNGEDINGPILEEAFALVREAAWRVLEQRHYDVQLIGGMVLHDGRLAEMATGEGKTLVATLPSFLNALSGKKTAFVVTVNDYLAKRDYEKMGQVHAFLGLSVGLIQSGMTEEARREAYSSNVVYVTNSELGFDYLRDNLALSVDQTVLPPSLLDGFCIVDEADSVLIDEARTPLIIAKQVPAPSGYYRKAQKLAEYLKRDVHYNVDLKNKNCYLTEDGYAVSEDALRIKNLFDMQPDGETWISYVANAVKAKELFNKDIEYSVIMEGDKKWETKKVGVGIIDSFTGRVMDGRRWSDGLHQSVEAKEGIAVSERSQVTAKVTYQTLFRQFARLSGMTGTATSDADEFREIYGLLVTPVPTALPIARRDYPDVAWKTRKGADDAMIKEIINVGGGNPEGRPCLIGTTSVQQSENIVAALAENGIEAQLLNALPENAARESEIIAQAGRAGVVTVATNMAGRGTDILLGGCSKTMSRLKARSILVQDGVLSPEEAATLPPSPPNDYYPTEISNDVIAMITSASAALKKSQGSDLSAIRLDEILTVAIDSTESDEDEDHIIKLRNAVEAVNQVYAPILAEEKEVVKARGGLYVMGTNRHESSRIDDQLRGRAGRQGDPGTSRFFLSFEDDMFVVFGGDRLMGMLDTFRVSDDIPVEAKQIAEALDRVQSEVAGKFYRIRSEIFRFDEVLNRQRQRIYQTRRELLEAPLDEILTIMRRYNEVGVKEIIQAQTSGKTMNVEKVMEKLEQFFPSAARLIQPDDLSSRSVEDATNFVLLAVDETFNMKIAEKEKLSKEQDVVAKTTKYLMLVCLDNAWSTHLQGMENLKEAVLLRVIKSLDPYVEYKKGGQTLFLGLEDNIKLNTVFSLW
eukprot:CAMPEP_0118697794 /NCGR_PEP_ID=MMETSP0800-20121206/14759_1 /TAXON_ID=210618 ORGANISM="Striatella unipunctata, Strain CCMP2910" /NCGR_SAMPLE_ID=MMETSP0800 /ASSEMBLY_ACC=CAM_ASM_000638 /LENGTH=928 /DNA_ID=CAMNT_0006597375 /DNA_START=302 /DNA_END=3086 /DNA_ORIENTATION=+